MASMMTSLSVFVLLVSSCWSAPFKVGAGGKVGVSSALNLGAGGSGTITRDGLSFMGDGAGVLGANWKGGAYAGGYTNLNDNYLAGQAAGGVDLAAGLAPSIHTALGIDSNGNIPLAFDPKVGLLGNAGLSGNAVAASGNDARSLAATYGDTSALLSLSAPKIY